MAAPVDPFIRFLRFVQPTDSTCWAWTGTTAGAQRRPTFRATTSAADPKVYAFRWAYEHERGPIPEGLELDHTCRNHWCVNPNHGEPVTHAENMRRARLSVCRAGLHDLTIPENCRWDSKGQRRGCLACNPRSV